jgi:hypothetical protein
MEQLVQIRDYALTAVEVVAFGAYATLTALYLTTVLYRMVKGVV